MTSPMTPVELDLAPPQRGPRRRRRRRGHERHRRGAGAPWATACRAATSSRRPALERLRGARASRSHVGHDAAHVGTASTLVAISTAIPADNPEVPAPRRARHPRAAAGRVLAAIAATAPHDRGRRHARQDDHVVDAGARPGRGRPATRRSSSAARSTRSAPGAVWDAGEWFVVEADESDGTFLELGAEAAVVTNVEPDHLEHYGGFDALVAAFEPLPRRRRGRRGGVRRRPGRGRALGAATSARSPTARAADADYRMVDLRSPAGRGVAASPSSTAASGSAEVELPVPGAHNARNAAAALVTARSSSASLLDAAAAALARFGGVARRFEFRGERGGVTFVDDYAHLPAEVARRPGRGARRRLAAGRVRVPAPPLQPHRGAVARLRRRLRRRRRAGRDRHLRAPARRPGRASPGKLMRRRRARRPPVAPGGVRCPRRRRARRLPARRAAPGRPVPDPRRRRPHHPLPDELLDAARSERREATAAGRARPCSATRGPARRAPARAAHDLPGRRAGRRCCCRGRGARRPRPWPRRRSRRSRASPVLVVGRGSNLLVADRGFPGLAVRLGERRSPRSSVDGTGPCGPAARGEPARCWPGARRPPASPGSSGRSGVPGLGRRRGAHERRRPRLRHRRHACARRRVVDLTGGGAGRAWPPARPRPRLPALGARAAPGRRRRPSSRCAPGDAGRGRGARSPTIVRWRREHQPGGPNAGSVFTNPPATPPAASSTRPGCKGLRRGIRVRVAEACQLLPGRRRRLGRRRAGADAGGAAGGGAAHRRPARARDPHGRVLMRRDPPSDGRAQDDRRGAPARRRPDLADDAPAEESGSARASDRPADRAAARGGPRGRPGSPARRLSSCSASSGSARRPGRLTRTPLLDVDQVRCRRRRPARRPTRSCAASGIVPGHADDRPRRAAAARAPATCCRGSARVRVRRRVAGHRRDPRHASGRRAAVPGAGPAGWALVDGSGRVLEPDPGARRRPPLDGVPPVGAARQPTLATRRAPALGVAGALPARLRARVRWRCARGRRRRCDLLLRPTGSVRLGAADASGGQARRRCGDRAEPGRPAPLAVLDVACPDTPVLTRTLTPEPVASRPSAEVDITLNLK